VKLKDKKATLLFLLFFLLYGFCFSLIINDINNTDENIHPNGYWDNTVQVCTSTWLYVTDINTTQYRNTHDENGDYDPFWVWAYKDYALEVWIDGIRTNVYSSITGYGTLQERFTSDNYWINAFDANYNILPGTHTLKVIHTYAFCTDLNNLTWVNSTTESPEITVNTELLVGCLACQNVDKSVDPNKCLMCEIPFSLMTGKQKLMHRDVDLLGSIRLTRVFNPRDDYPGYMGILSYPDYYFGKGWFSEYDQYIEDCDGWVYYMDEAGRLVYLERNSFTSYSNNQGYSLTRNGNDYDASWTLQKGCCGEQQTLTFDCYGRLSTITDAKNNTINIEYIDVDWQEGGIFFGTVINQLIDIKGSNEEEMILMKNNYELIDTVYYWGPSGDTTQNYRVLKYQYDDWNLTSVTDEIGDTTYRYYYSDTDETKISKYVSHGITYNWDCPEGVNAEVFGEGSTVHYQFTNDTVNNTITQTDDNNTQVTYHLNDSGKTVQKDLPDGSNRQLKYDQYNNVTTYVTENGTKVDMFYDAYSNMTAIIDYQQNTTQYFYNTEFNVATTYIDAMGHRYDFQLDFDGNVTQAIDPMGYMWTFNYSDKGFLTRIQNPLGEKTYYYYDAFGNMTSTCDANGNQNFMYYNGFGDLTCLRDALSHSIYMEYDSGSRMTTQISPGERISKYIYSGTNLQSVIDSMGHTTEYEYNSLGIATSAIASDSSRFYIYYNNYGQKTALRDALGNMIYYEYDNRGRKTKVTDALGLYTQYYWDSASNITTIRKYDGTTLARLYDSFGQMTAYSLGYNLPGISQKTTYLWRDALGQVTTKLDTERGCFNYYFDSLGRQITEIHDQSTTLYYYDAMSRRTTLIDRLGHDFNYSFDSVGDLSQIVNWVGQTTKYYYNAIGLLTTEVYPNNIRTSYSYNENNEMILQETFKNGNALINRLAYSYNPDGNRVTMSDKNGGITCYYYDQRHRLIKEMKYDQPIIKINTGITVGNSSSDSYMAKITIGENLIGISTGGNYRMNWGSYPEGSSSKIYLRSYEYDSSGNRLKMIWDSNTTAYIYNAFNQLSIMSTNGNEILFSYDSNGNLLSKEDREYVWNLEGKLLSVDSVNYQYDESGRRYLRIFDNNTTEYVYDGSDPIAELSNGNLQKVFTLTGGMVGQVISCRNGDNDYFYHYDTNGNVIFITDSTGEIISEYTQEGFGNILTSTGIYDNGYHLATKEYDSESGLYYFGARWYDPETGRWLSPEPLRLDGPNLYQYVFNNPIRYNDYNGYVAAVDDLAIAGTIVLVGGTLYVTNPQVREATNDLIQELKRYVDDYQFTSDRRKVNECKKNGNKKPNGWPPALPPVLVKTFRDKLGKSIAITVSLVEAVSVLLENGPHSPDSFCAGNCCQIPKGKTGKANSYFIVISIDDKPEASKSKYTNFDTSKMIDTYSTCVTEK